MSKHIEHLGREILYEVPTTTALIFAGATTYIGTGDVDVRLKLG